MPNISVKGSKIHYIAGKDFIESRPSVLMIHGAGQSIATWEYQWPALKDHPDYNLVIIDLPGHRESEGAGCKTIQEYADFVRSFTENLGLERLALVGHSMGGAIAQVLAINHPEMVSACVLVGTGARMRVAKETLSAVKNNYEVFCDVAPTRSFAHSAPEELKKRFREGLTRTPQDISYGDLVACDEFDITHEVAKIKAPTLVISGSEDILTPVKYGEYLHDKIERSEFYAIDGAGHFMMLEKPEEFNAVLLEFLGSLRL